MGGSTKMKEFDNISVSKIYETLKSKQFLEDLWWDMLSDIEQKPSYKRIKNMVGQLITQNVGFCLTAFQDSDKVKRQNLLAEISILSYTIDTVISQVLHKKLQNEFPSVIKGIIDELRTEAAKKETGALNGNSVENHGETSKNSSANIEDRKKENDLIEKNSDAESDISDLKFSDCSVSSVHTSELSSYNDEISISSEEENDKKEKLKISVRDASDKFLQGKAEEIYNMAKPVKMPKDTKSQIPKKRGRPKKTKLSPKSAEELPPKALREVRIRKPNSKYSSEDIVCPMKSFPTSDQSTASECSSPRGSPIRESPELSSKPTRKRKRPKRFEEEEPEDLNEKSPFSSAAAEDLSAIEVSKAAAKPQTSLNQKLTSNELPKRPSGFNNKERTAFTLFSTKH